jgi:hypothetical protein
MTLEFYACGQYSTDETKKRWKKKHDEYWKDIVEIHYVIKEGD